jgi:hypothetical protein
MNGQDKIVGLKNRISRTLLKERITFFSAGLTGTIFGLIITAAILSLLAGVVILPVGVKIILLFISGLISLFIFWKLAFSRLFGGSVETTAIKLEKKFPELKGRLIAALQFSAMKEGDRAGYSNDLMLATLLQAEDKASDLNFGEIISAYPVWRNLRNLGISLAAALLMLFIFPGLFSYSYEVYSRPTELVAPPLGYKLTPYPGDATAIKYRDIDLGAIIYGDKYPDKAFVYYRFSEGNWQKTEIDLKGIMHHPAGPAGDSSLVTTTIKQARRSLEYYVRAGRITTPTSHIDVVDRPRVNGIKLSLFYPEYTGLPPSVIDENDGNISAVVGTRANVKIETNLPVATAEMVFDDSSRSRFEPNGLTAEQSLKIERDRRYIIRLVDRQGEINPDPIEYHITAIPDEYPAIDVVRPGVDINLSDDMVVPILLRISDDYGFSSMILKYNLIRAGEKGEEKVAVLHFSDRIKTEGEINFNWDVEPLHLEPSDLIQYNFELADNDRIGGPKVTVSRQYIARLPSLEEIISQTEQEQTENIDKAEEYLKAQKELSERLQNIARKMEQERSGTDQKLAWQHQQELKEIAANEEKVSEQIKEAAKKMNEFIDKMEQNKAASRELLEKLAEIQKLFEEVATPEMKAARLKLMEALKEMDPQKLEEALKEFQLSQEELMERLDRTIALLKKMKIEQKINVLTELAKDLVNNQEKMNTNTSESKAEQLPSLAPNEKKVKGQLDNLKKQVGDLRQMLKETPYNKAEEADKFCRAVENNEAGQNMDNMTEALSDKEKEKSLDEGKTALSKLKSMLETMEKGQASMCKGSDDEMARKMRETIDDVNYLSDRQKTLIDRAGSITGESEVLRDMAAQQQIIKESVTGLSRKIMEMGKESPFIAAELNNIIRTTLGNLELAIDKFSDRRGIEAQSYQREALYDLNRAAVRMMDALEQQSQCNKGGSCSKPSQKLNSLCDKQNMLNQETQSLCRNPKNMGAGNAEALKRLAGEQDGIRKSLAQLQQEFGNSKEVLGRLDAITDDMEKVVDQLGTGQVGEETLERQLKVYSRMLDATKTLQRKDFTDQRKAETGKDIFRNSPPALSGNQLQGGLDAEDRLRQFLNESYPAEYEQHIKAYFKALLQNEDNRRIQLDYESK